MELFSTERRGVLRGLEMGVALLTGFLLFQTHITNLISFLNAILKVICKEKLRSKLTQIGNQRSFLLL